ncbi:hypothetical protein [Hymenobacter wooponensis]|uniref:Outer membrane protein beta-barrel domain-containing protein n=1 Tax=Hymenobacter wooponensis TaxID=1525360 RepID=A0A4Z0MLJ7_9BACT|nr:hypothetical protein [Hymenobacter wooponensis]TGD80494.1 hypothetical protein EU557_11715 [Hymenobacter wooponensis]
MRFLPVAFTTVLLTVSAAQQSYAQRVLLRSNTSQDTVRATYGPNRAFFRHLYVSYVPIVGSAASAGAELRAFKSAEYSLGVRHKYRLSNKAATGFDLRYTRLNYALAQTDDKILPSASKHYSEALILHQLVVEPYVRLNFGRRGNVVGHYLDLTGWAGWVAGTVHAYEDRPGAQGASRTVVHERGLTYLRRWPAGVGARVGSNRYAAVVRYRLTDTFTDAASAIYPELPRWSAGLELGLF